MRAYADDPRKELEVVVADGVVAIAATGGGDSLLLRAAEPGRVTAAGRLLAEHGVDVRARLGWTQGRLEFKNVPLREVLSMIARWYDATVRVEDTAIAEYPITVTITGERFDEAVDIIARALDVRVVKRDNEVVFVGRMARR